MSLTILTHYLPNYSDVFDLVAPNREAYCARHGYKHLVHCGSYHNESWYYGFQRLKLLRDALGQPGATEWYWVFNVSGLITNLTKPVLDLVDDEHDCLLCKDVHGINFGSALFRNSQFSRQWLDFLVSLEPQCRAHAWKDQFAVQQTWLHEDWTHKIHLLAQRQLQSFEYRLYAPWNETTSGNWRRGDLAVQWPGRTKEQRIEHIREFLDSDRIVQ